MKAMDSFSRIFTKKTVYELQKCKMIASQLEGFLQVTYV